MKNHRYIGIVVPAFLYMMMFSLIGILIPKGEDQVIQTISLLTWSVMSVYVRWKRSYIFSTLLTILAATCFSSVMLMKELTLLNKIDKVSAEVFGLAPEVTSQIIIGLAVFVSVSLMNYLVDAIKKDIAGEIKGFKKFTDAISRVIAPICIASILIGIGVVKNKAESKKTHEMIAFASASEPVVAEVQEQVGTDWQYSSLPQDKINEIKTFENGPLVRGKIKASILAKDPLKKTVTQVGYGITNAEIQEAIHYGFLPAGSTLPKRLTKEEADKWFEAITIPTYLAQVREVLNPSIKLNGHQLVGLFSFCHNLGKDNLKILLNKPGCLNDGNVEETLENMVKYCNVITVKKGKRIVTPYAGLIKRREWEKKLLATLDTPPIPEAIPPTLL